MDTFRAFLLEQSHGHRPAQPVAIEPVRVVEFARAMGPATWVLLAAGAVVVVLFA